MGDPSTPTNGDTAPAMPEPWQFSLSQLLLWMTAASAALAATYWLGCFGASLAMLLLVGYVPYRLQLCTLFESTAIAMALAAIIVVLVPMPFPSQGREAARRAACRNNLMQINIALLNYHDVYGTFPPAYIPNANGKPMHSWRVLILPFMEQEPLYKQYRFDEPWDGPNNRQLHSVAVRTFSCPSSDNRLNSSYLAVVGSETAWPGPTSVSLDDVRDNEDETLLVVEVHDSGIHWMEPKDLRFAEVVSPNSVKATPGPSSKHPLYGNRINAGFVSGGTEWLSKDLPPKQWRAILTIDGGEKVELP